MSHSWLQKKRKGELLELAQRANMPDADQLLKDDLVVALEGHLNANESTYAKQAAFTEYYGRSGSPVKRERSSPSIADALVAPKTRRRTLVKRVDSEDSTPVKSATSVIATRTPRALSRMASRASEVENHVASRVAEVDIPASPAQLAEYADQSFQVAKTKATEIWDQSRIDDARDWLRENVSSVTAIQTLVLAVEAFGLQYNTYGEDCKTRALFSTPKISTYANSHEVKVPTLECLLTSDWWAPATLWSLTSLVLPLIVSYFFNLTLRSNTHHRSSNRQSRIDPFTFNIAKAILAYSAYHLTIIPDTQMINQGHMTNDSWGPFAAKTVSRVYDNVPHKYNGLQIGALVGLLVSLYDAALKK